MTRHTSAFVAFWYDFIVGDDWRIAIGVVTALALTYGLSNSTVPSWWVLPATVLILLPPSLRRAALRRRSGPTSSHSSLTGQPPQDRT